MNELQQRFSDFLEKLLAKAEELTNEVKITIQETYDSDTDAYKRNFFNFKNWIEGQYRWIIKKAEDVFESQIKPKYLMTFEQSLQSSMQKTIEYGGQETPVTLFWTVNQALLEGTYNVSIFTDGNMIGSRSFSFK